MEQCPLTTKELKIDKIFTNTFPLYKYVRNIINRLVPKCNKTDITEHLSCCPICALQTFKQSKIDKLSMRITEDLYLDPIKRIISKAALKK